jgi:hypothetical protein
MPSNTSFNYMYTHLASFMNATCCLPLKGLYILRLSLGIPTFTVGSSVGVNKESLLLRKFYLLKRGSCRHFCAVDVDISRRKFYVFLILF